MRNEWKGARVLLAVARSTIPTTKRRFVYRMDLQVGLGIGHNFIYVYTTVVHTDKINIPRWNALL
jgi:hypothetical protein